MSNAACKKVFLGGTCNGSQWRAHLIKHLKAVLELCKRNGVTTFKNSTMLELSMYLNLRYGV